MTDREMKRVAESVQILNESIEGLLEVLDDLVATKTSYHEESSNGN